jgi:hypothetical protein
MCIGDRVTDYTNNCFCGRTVDDPEKDAQHVDDCAVKGPDKCVKEFFAASETDKAEDLPLYLVDPSYAVGVAYYPEPMRRRVLPRRMHPLGAKVTRA